jgi:hypothetical protein
MAKFVCVACGLESPHHDREAHIQYGLQKFDEAGEAVRSFGQSMEVFSRSTKALSVRLFAFHRAQYGI